MPSIQCLTPDCTERATNKGLCMKCYSEAKNLVEVKKITTWEALAEMGLADLGESKFMQAFKNRNDNKG